MTEKLPQEVYESETFNSLRSRAEDLLNSKEKSEISSSLLTSSTHNQQSGRPKRRMEQQQHIARVDDLSRDGKNIFPDSNRASISRGDEPQPSPENESQSFESSTARTEGGKEVMEQFEHGVFVTILQFRNGTKVFKRVKFRYISLAYENHIFITIHTHRHDIF